MNLSLENRLNILKSLAVILSLVFIFDLLIIIIDYRYSFSRNLTLSISFVFLLMGLNFLYIFFVFLKRMKSKINVGKEEIIREWKSLNFFKKIEIVSSFTGFIFLVGGILGKLLPLLANLINGIDIFLKNI